MPTDSVSKDEYLKRYLEPKKTNRKRHNGGNVQYISGDLPETLDGLCQDETDGFSFPGTYREAPTIVRKPKKDSSKAAAEAAEKLEAGKKQAQLQAKYDVWNKGVKTLEETYLNLKEQEYERTKPLARYADDADLTQHLKSQIHKDDPMAAYFSGKKKKKKKEEKKKKKHSKKSKEESSIISSSSESENDDDDATAVNKRPKYQGPEPPPNRYDIIPGYRWDGVDRSNGFEQKIVDETNQRRIERELAQQWAMEDM